MVLQCEIFDILFLYEDEDIDRFSNYISVPLAKSLWDKFIRKGTKLSGDWKIVPTFFSR